MKPVVVDFVDFVKIIKVDFVKIIKIDNVSKVQDFPGHAKQMNFYY